MKVFIENLKEHQRGGFDFIGFEIDKSETKTQTGVKTVLVRLREYKYNLTLQDLTLDDINYIVGLLEYNESVRPYRKIVIPVNLFTGYIGKGVNDVSFNFSSEKITLYEDEQTYSIVLEVSEVEVEDVKAEWILAESVWNNDGVWQIYDKWNT